MTIDCLICTESFSQIDSIYSTLCGHVFHFYCILQWLLRSNTCPHCRKQVKFTDIHKIYLNYPVDIDRHKVFIPLKNMILEDKIRAHAQRSASQRLELDKIGSNLKMEKLKEEYELSCRTLKEELLSSELKRVELEEKLKLLEETEKGKQIV